jgi:hypothetical protein
MTVEPATPAEIKQVMSILLPQNVSQAEFTAHLRQLVALGVLQPDPPGSTNVKVVQEHPQFERTLAVVRAGEWLQ